MSPTTETTNIRASELATTAGEIVSLLNPAALYRLAAASTPGQVVTDVVGMLQRGDIPTEGEIAALVMLYNQRCEPEEPTGRDGEGHLALRLASELYSRIDAEMARRLISGPWDQIRDCLRLLINRPQQDVHFNRAKTTL